MMNYEKPPESNNDIVSDKVETNHVPKAVYDSSVLPGMTDNFTLQELICVFLSWIVGFAYSEHQAANLIVVFSGIVAMTFLIHKGKTFSSENYIWLACFALSTAGYILSITKGGLCLGVWDSNYQFYFVHIYAVWFVLCASKKMYKGQTSTYLPLDALNGFIAFPFRYILRRIKVLFLAVKSLFAKKEKRSHNYYLIPAIIISVVLFFMAAKLLGQADTTFGKLLEEVRDFLSFDFELDDVFVIRLIVATPVGTYLYGLIVGSAKVEEESLHRFKETVDKNLESFKKIPVKFWTVIICLFSLLYLAFFALQFQYLFGAFTRTLPEGFIVSQYAREGFFELCKVMAVNFALLLVVTRMVKADSAKDRLFAGGCIAILAESMLFSVIAFSKLALYIDCFGFTPLRVQSLWLICVLFAGCVLWMVNLLEGKTTFKLWIYIAAISLSVLSLM